jgi:hypothetical protein
MNLEKNTKLAFKVWDTTKDKFPNLDSAQGASSDMGLDFRLSGFKFCGKELPGRGKFIPSKGEDLLAPPTVDRDNQDKGQTNQMRIALAPLVSASHDVAESIRGGTRTRRHVTFHFYSDGDDGKCTVTAEFNECRKDFVLKTWKDSMYSGAFPCEDEELKDLSNKVHCEHGYAAYALVS